MQLIHCKLSNCKSKQLLCTTFVFIQISVDFSCVSLINCINLYDCILEGLRLKHFIAVALIVANMTKTPS